jgi:hypothetical protein
MMTMMMEEEGVVSDDDDAAIRESIHEPRQPNVTLMEQKAA